MGVASVPEGLEHLSEEEQLKILTVMQSAEIDSLLMSMPSKLSTSKNEDYIDKISNNLKKSSSYTNLPFKTSTSYVNNTLCNIKILPEDGISTQQVETKKMEEKNLTGLENLSEAEQMQILKVMQMAAEQDNLLDLSSQKTGLIFITFSQIYSFY